VTEGWFRFSATAAPLAALRRSFGLGAFPALDQVEPLALLSSLFYAATGGLPLRVQQRVYFGTLTLALIDFFLVPARRPPSVGSPAL